ncbi:hypothetical protein A6X20_12775 [Bradyrhizobium elkanii]|nr:hypothetical protein A6452_06690 [Bradyrhizobium elkanii]ODM84803.1 hypothetical protein A6X20_12775 [Bradyrhizobium elkanii]
MIDAFRFGYRCKQTGVPFATVEIPTSMMAERVPLEASARMTVDGKIVVDAQLPSIDHSSMLADRSTGTSLVQLIEETLGGDNLRMEEATQRELSSLLQELETSIQLVKAVLADLPLPRFDA